MIRKMVLVLALCPLAAAQSWEATIAKLELSRDYDHGLFKAAASDEDARTRRLAARAAGRIKDARALEWLLPLLKDPVGPVRRSALFALGQIGKDVMIALRASIRDLRDADLPNGLEALGKTRDVRAVSTVVRYLTHDSGDVRGEAALALFRIGDHSALPDLLAAILAETKPEPRWRMMYTAFRLLLAKRRQTGAQVLVNRTWVGVLQLAAQDKRPYHERVFATRALGLIAGQEKHVIALLRDEDPRVVVAAIRALHGGWDEETWKALQAAVANDKNPLLREAYIRWLISMTPKDPKKAARQSSIVKMALGSAATGARLWKWDWLHMIAAEAAARAGGGQPAVASEHGVDEELLWRVNSSFPDKLPDRLPATVRAQAAAAEVCGQKRVVRGKALMTLEKLLKIKDFTVRATAISSIAKREGKQLVEAIIAAAKDSPGLVDIDVRLEACKALRDMGVYHEWLKTAAVDPHWPVRDAAREALEKLKQPLPEEIEREIFRLNGQTAGQVIEAARALQGARVTLETNRGKIEMVLLPDEAPAHCVNFARLVQKKFYDGLTWHRVVADFVIQGACPRGDGWGGPGYLLPDEIGTRPYVRGTVGMPRSGNDTGGCQIFITHLPTPHLDGRYSVYAQVVSGLDVVDRIRVGDKIVRATLTRPAPR